MDNPLLQRIATVRSVFFALSLFLPVTMHAQEAVSPVAQENHPAVSVIKELHERLTYIMQNAESLGYQGRYDHVKDIVSERFDTGLIAKVIMSRYWKELEDVEKLNFIDLFRKLSIATYASRFDSYDGENFVELSTEQLKKGRLLIKTELQRPDDTPVKLDYLVHQRDEQWKIISVIANGVNDLSLKRAEYATVIKDRGFQGLVSDVSTKITDMEQKDTKL